MVRRSYHPDPAAMGMPMKMMFFVRNQHTQVSFYVVLNYHNCRLEPPRSALLHRRTSCMTSIWGNMASWLNLIFGIYLKFIFHSTAESIYTVQKLNIYFVQLSPL